MELQPRTVLSLCAIDMTVSSPCSDSTAHINLASVLVQGTGVFIQNEHFWIEIERPRQSYPLALSPLSMTPRSPTWVSSPWGILSITS